MNSNILKISIISFFCSTLISCSRVPNNLQGNYRCDSHMSVSLSTTQMRINHVTFSVDEVSGNLILVNGNSISFDPILGKLYMSPGGTLHVYECKKS